LLVLAAVAAAGSTVFFVRDRSLPYTTCPSTAFVADQQTCKGWAGHDTSDVRVALRADGTCQVCVNPLGSPITGVVYAPGKAPASCDYQQIAREEAAGLPSRETVGFSRRRRHQRNRLSASARLRRRLTPCRHSKVELRGQPRLWNAVDCRVRYGSQFPLASGSHDYLPAWAGRGDVQGRWPTFATSAFVSPCFSVELTAGSPIRLHIVTAQSASSRQYSE